MLDEELSQLQLKRRPLEALIRTAKYRDAYKAWVSVRSAFPLLASHGLVDLETKEVTPKGLALVRLVVTQELEEMYGRP